MAAPGQHRQRRPRRCAGAQHGAEIAGVLDAVQHDDERNAVRRRRHEPGRFGQQAGRRGNRREFGKQRVGQDDGLGAGTARSQLREALPAERGSARQRVRLAAGVEIGRQQVLAVEQRHLRLAPRAG